jgi:DNA-binding transcriptional LysR family regulator
MSNFVLVEVLLTWTRQKAEKEAFWAEFAGRETIACRMRAKRTSGAAPKPGGTSQLNIGYIANIYHDLLPLTLGTFRRACPRTALNLFEMTPAERYQALDEHKLDLGFVCFRTRSVGSDLHWKSIGHDILMVAVAARSPLAKKAKIDLRDLKPLCFVGMSRKTYPGSNEWLIDACREAGFTARILQDGDREPAVRIA